MIASVCDRGGTLDALVRRLTAIKYAGTRNEERGIERDEAWGEAIDVETE